MGIGISLKKNLATLTREAKIFPGMFAPSTGVCDCNFCVAVFSQRPGIHNHANPLRALLYVSLCKPDGLAGAPLRVGIHTTYTELGNPA